MGARHLVSHPSGNPEPENFYVRSRHFYYCSHSISCPDRPPREKYRPDTYFINTPERYFTTTGIEKAQTARAKELLKYENRNDTSTEYFGGGELAEAHGPYLQVPDSFRPSRRPELASNVKHITNTHAPNKHNATSGDHGIQGYKSSVLPNNRDITQTRGGNEFGIVGSFLQAVTAPLMDVLRPSRKENVVGNMRPNGNVGVVDHEAGYVYNPNDRAKTTIREMTEDRPEHYYLNNQKELGGYGYVVNKKQPTSQERDTTNISYTGTIGNTSNTSNAQVYDSAYNAHLIDKEPISQGRTPMGSSVKMFNGQSYMNVEVDKLECDRNNNRMYVPQQLGYGATPSVQQIGATTAIG